MRVQIVTREGVIFRAKRADPGHAWTCSLVNILKAIQQGAALVLFGCQLECTRWRSHWHNLANITEPSVCIVGDVATYQISLTTCLQFMIV